MNRSVERRRLHAYGNAEPGEVIVPKGFVHPRRGPVRSVAAPLLVENLRRHGHRARIADVRAEPGETELALFAVSYLDLRGKATGFATAACTTDETAIARAENTAEQWSHTLRTRRILVATVTTPCTDACALTCPMVLRTRARVRRFTERGDTVLLIGKAGAVAARLRIRDTVPVESSADVDVLERLDPDRISFVIVPGTPVEDAFDIAAALRQRFPQLRGQHPDEFCYAASDRREAVRSVAAASELLFTGADAQEVTATDHAHLLDRATDMRPEWLTSATTIGIVPSCGAPELPTEIIELLSGLGPIAVAHRRVTTTKPDGVQAAEPPGLPSSTPATGCHARGRTPARRAVPARCEDSRGKSSRR
ncbi:hypothetical protein [Saccharopolyspora sp. 5N708]|uniref:hypothetical protein n=1 Tax=Saccharopolyspora sp. 5N708 TaxID=3457424 RepID=UPI003FD6A917